MDTFDPEFALKELALDAAEQLIECNGLGGLNGEAIARILDRPVEDIRDLFGSREGAMEALLARFDERFRAELQASAAELKPGALEAYAQSVLRMYFRFVRDNPVMLAVRSAIPQRRLRQQDRQDSHRNADAVIALLPGGHHDDLRAAIFTVCEIAGFVSRLLVELEDDGKAATEIRRVRRHAETLLSGYLGQITRAS